jgi:hypothetical protein
VQYFLKISELPEAKKISRAKAQSPPRLECLPKDPNPFPDFPEIFQKFLNMSKFSRIFIEKLKKSENIILFQYELCIQQPLTAGCQPETSKLLCSTTKNSFFSVKKWGLGQIWGIWYRV